MIKIILFTTLFTSCTVIPLYKIKKVELCEQQDYDTYCEGYNN